MTVAENGLRPAGRAMDGGILPGRPSRRVPALVSVVIPAYNAESTIAEQLDALVAQTYDGTWNVIVCDNRSTDGTRAIVDRYADRLPGLRVIEVLDGQGVHWARNAGAAVGGDLIAICDADDAVVPGWLAALVEAAAGADVVGGALDHEALNDPEISGWRGGGSDELPTAFDFLPYAIGANVAVWRDVWEQVGGWSTEYSRCGSEDVDFSWRVQLAGFRLAFAPDAISRYRHRPSATASAKQVYGYAHTGTYLYRRFQPHGARRRSLPAVAGSWGNLLVRSPYLVLSRRRRGIWLVNAADNVGRLAGSVRNRVFCP